MRIALIGAYDRNNFGDLLMPIVFEKQYKRNNTDKRVKFEYYGQAKRDMGYLKSYSTKPIYECYNNCDIAIVVGGEVLTANYKLMYFNLQKNKIKIFILRCFNKISPSFMEKFARKRLKGRENKPWILDKDKMGCKKIIYNTVGGKIGDNIIDREALKKVDYISIRNKKDIIDVSKINKNAKLYPDSVSTISKIFDDTEINKNTKEDIKELAKNKYFIVQIDKRDGKELIKKIGNQINKICEQFDINCILLPIGYAQGHEDQVVLKKICQYCRSEKVKMPPMTNIYETLYLLKNSEMFIGTSLHGIIISTSYNVQHMILTNKIKKLLDYMDSWKTTPINYTSADDMYKNFKILHSNENAKKRLKKFSEELINYANENFENINNIINEVYENEKRE